MKKKILLIIAFILICTIGVWGITQYKTRALQNKVLIHESDTLSITIEPVIKEEENLKMWVATIKIKDANQIKSAFSGGDFNSGIKEKTSKMAKDNDAILAINGSAVNFTDKGIIVRDGEVYRSKTNDCAPLVIDNNGDFKVYSLGEKTADELVEEGAMHTYDFGPELVVNGKIPENFQNQAWFFEDLQPKTAIGQKGHLEYVVIVADGRSSESKGISNGQLAEEFINRGCNIAYNLDGGGSSTLWFKGNVINNPSDIIGERRIYDILYFSE